MNQARFIRLAILMGRNLSPLEIRLKNVTIEILLFNSVSQCKQNKNSHRPISFADEFCEEYPHALIPTPGYWIECSRQKIAQINQHTIWDDSESDHDEPRPSCSGNDGQHERNYGDLYEDDEDSDFVPRRKTTIEEQWEQQASFELTSVEQETYEKYFYGSEHWNYFTNDEDLGPVILSIKQETLNGRDQFRILVRAISYTVHGLIPASCVFADR